MKKLAVIGILIASFGLHAQTADTYIQLSRDGDASPALRFGPTDMDGCRAAAPKIGMAGVYTCTWTYSQPKTAAPAVSVVPTVPVMPVAPSPAGATQTVPPVVAATLPTAPASAALSIVRTTDATPVIVKPARGALFVEPTYKTNMRRVTDHAADGVSGFAINDYSRRQAFNADGSKYLIYDTVGAWHLYDASTFKRIKTLSGPSGDSEPEWSSTDPDKLIYLPTNGMGMKLNELSVSTNTSRVVGDLGARLKAKWPTAAAAWTKSEGSPSKDGRYWCFMVESVSSTYDMDTVGIVTYDLTTDTIIGSMPVAKNRPDHVSMSPSGNYCVASWANSTGTVSYSRDFSASLKVHTTSEHSDLAIDASGDDVYVSVDYQSAGGDVFMVNLRTGERATLFSTYTGGDSALHISGKAFDKPGWVVASVYANTYGRQWFQEKVLAVQLKANPTIYSLAFHRSKYISGQYYTEPHASVNHDFTKIIFNSNWGANTGTDLDAYQIELPAGAVK